MGTLCSVWGVGGSGMHGAAFFASGRGGAEEKNFGVGAGRLECKNLGAGRRAA